jgi:FG-GAP-like repeat/Secretion system C-terminal sorting domain
MSSRTVVLCLVAILSLVSIGLCQPEWIPHVISDEIDYPLSIRAIDFDLDGDLDFVTGMWTSRGCDWWEQTLEGFVRHPISNLYKYAHAEPVDLDQDGDVDVVGCSYYSYKLIIIENTAGEFVEHVIDDTADGAFYASVVDLDQDGDLDIIAAYYESGETVWHENQGDQFIRHMIAENLDGRPVRVEADDMDGDGDLDVVIADFDYQFGRIVVAYNYNQASEWVIEPVLDNYDGAWNTTLLDINSNGRLDILTSAHSNGSIDWLENTANGFVQHHLIDLTGARDLQAVDVDDDGQLDLVSASYADGISWWEQSGIEWIQHIVDNSITRASFVVAEDIDGDGDIDLATAAHNEDQIIWYEQVGSPYTIDYDIIPTNPPIILPPSGGTITYSGSIQNSDAMTYAAQHETWAQLPSGNMYGPISINNFTISPFMELTVNGMTLDVPANAPAGSYQFIGKLILPEFTLESGFPFHKLEGVATSNTGSSDWQASEWLAELASEDAITSQPNQFRLHPAMPNPFNPSTTIRVTLPEASELSVVIFNTSGQKVATLAHGSQSAGTDTFEFDGQDLASGVYFIHADVPGKLRAVQKIVYLK